MVERRNRIAAIDVFRGLTMFFMLWVNSFWSLSEVPHWLQHAARGEDMLGFSDTIFPAFLFIMGASVPLAVAGRRAKGDSTVKIVWHILTRAFALVVMGLLTVNFGDAFSAAGTGLSRGNYAMLMVLGFFLVWNVYPKAGNVWQKRGILLLQLAGVALLVWLAVIFRGSDGSGFSVRWWGILGRIGWTYLFCALMFLAIGKRLAANVAVVALVVTGAVMQASGLIPGGLLPNQLTIFAFGSTGVLLSLLLERYADIRTPSRFYWISLFIGAGMLVAGLIAHRFWIVSKLAATPTWYFYCCAIFFPLFALLYYLTDVRGRTRWFAWVKPAGTAALSCYVVAYAWNPLKNLIFSDPLLRPEFSVGVLGLVNSFLYALLLIWAVWLLGRGGVKLKV